MKSIMSKNYVSHKKLTRDWTDRKNSLIYYRMLKFYVRHGTKINKVHSVISFKQSKWLEIYNDFNTQKRNQAVNDFEKDFYKLLKNAFCGKTLEHEILMDKPIYLGFAILELSKLHMYETYYDTLQP